MCFFCSFFENILLFLGGPTSRRGLKSGKREFFIRATHSKPQDITLLTSVGTTFSKSTSNRFVLSPVHSQNRSSCGRKQKRNQKAISGNLWQQQGDSHRPLLFQLHGQKRMSRFFLFSAAGAAVPPRTAGQLLRVAAARRGVPGAAARLHVAARRARAAQRHADPVQRDGASALQLQLHRQGGQSARTGTPGSAQRHRHRHRLRSVLLVLNTHEVLFFRRARVELPHVVMHTPLVVVVFVEDLTPPDAKTQLRLRFSSNSHT